MSSLGKRKENRVRLRVSKNMQIKERLTAENCCPVSLLYVVSKAFEKLVNNRIVDVLEKYVLFPYFQYVFRSS